MALTVALVDPAASSADAAAVPRRLRLGGGGPGEALVLSFVAVRPGYRGRGVAGSVYAALLDAAGRTGRPVLGYARPGTPGLGRSRPAAGPSRETEDARAFPATCPDWLLLFDRDDAGNGAARARPAVRFSTGYARGTSGSAGLGPFGVDRMPRTDPDAPAVIGRGLTFAGKPAEALDDAELFGGRGRPPRRRAGPAGRRNGPHRRTTPWTRPTASRRSRPMARTFSSRSGPTGGP